MTKITYVIRDGQLLEKVRSVLEPLRFEGAPPVFTDYEGWLRRTVADAYGFRRHYEGEFHLTSPPKTAR